MNAQTNAVAQQNNSSNQFVGLLNLEAFELSQRVAKMLSTSTLVPEQYRAVTKLRLVKIAMVIGSIVMKQIQVAYRTVLLR